MMDSENMYTTLPATAIPKSFLLMLSPLLFSGNITIINNNINNNDATFEDGSPIWAIISSIGGAIVALIGLITCLYNVLCKLRKYLQRSASVSESHQNAESGDGEAGSVNYGAAQSGNGRHSGPSLTTGYTRDGDMYKLIPIPLSNRKLSWKKHNDSLHTSI